LRLTLAPRAENAKAPTFFTKDQNGLFQDWGKHVVFCNPPYGKTMREWAHKCWEASQAGETVVLLAHLDEKRLIICPGNHDAERGVVGPHLPRLKDFRTDATMRDGANRLSDSVEFVAYVICWTLIGICARV